MIQARELRIGNLVNVKYWNPSPENPNWEYRKVKIVGVLKNTFYFSEKDKKSVHKIGELYSIPITEELLVQFGAEKFPSGDKSYVLNGVLITWAECRGVFIHNGIELKSVHQLQNLIYALTGKELELKEI